MENNSDIQINEPLADTPSPISQSITYNENASKLISAITDFIPAFFSPNGVLQKESDVKNQPSIREIIIHSEDFIKTHPNTFKDDESKNSFVINKLTGTARRWGLSLLTDGTLKKLTFEKFKKLLLENFDSGIERKQKYVIMDKLWKLKQSQLGSVAEYTIEFRRLAGRLGWPDEVLIDIIGKGLVDKVREEFDKVEKPSTLFEATNTIIGIDKKCYLESSLRNKTKNFKKNHKSFQKKRRELTKIENYKKHFHNKNKPKNDILSANYTSNGNPTITTAFYLNINDKNIRTNFLIDSGSARSFICRNFANSHKIPSLGLSSPINIQLPNSKSMNIKQTTKPLKLKIMDHTERFEFCIANIALQGINGILGRDWLSVHNPFIDYKKNKIFFLGKYCGSHCPSSRKFKFANQNSNFTATMFDNPAINNADHDSIIPESIPEDTVCHSDLSDSDLCAAMPTKIDSEGKKPRHKRDSRQILF